MDTVINVRSGKVSDASPSELFACKIGKELHYCFRTTIQSSAVMTKTPANEDSSNFINNNQLDRYPCVIYTDALVDFDHKNIIVDYNDYHPPAGSLFVSSDGVYLVSFFDRDLKLLKISDGSVNDVKTTGEGAVILKWRLVLRSGSHIHELAAYDVSRR